MKLFFKVWGWVTSSVMVIMLVLSLFINGTLLLWQGGALAIGAGLAAATGITTVASSLDKKRVSAESKTLELEAKNKTLTTELDTSKSKVGALTDDLGKTKADLADAKKKVDKGAVLEAADNIKARTARAATRNAGGVIAESIPYLGIAAVIGITAWDLKDACATMKDMDTIKEAMGETPDDSMTRQVCEIELPTKEEVWETVKTAPADAWSNVKDIDLPAWEDVKPAWFDRMMGIIAFWR